MCRTAAVAVHQNDRIALHGGAVAALVEGRVTAKPAKGLPLTQPTGVDDLGKIGGETCLRHTWDHGDNIARHTRGVAAIW